MRKVRKEMTRKWKGEVRKGKDKGNEKRGREWKVG